MSRTRAAVPPVCVEELGWITPAGANPCLGSGSLDDVDVHFPSLKAVGGEALPLPYGSAHLYQDISLKLTLDAFASAKGAAQATIDTMQTAYSTTLFLRNVTSNQRLAELRNLYGAAEWVKLGANAIAARGDLVEVDLMYTQGFNSTASKGPWWNVAAHALFHVKGGKGGSGADLGPSDDDQPASLVSQKVVYEPVAILLSNQPSDPHARLVYTPAKSESAYIIAALALRQVAAQTSIWVGHVSAASEGWVQAWRFGAKDSCAA